MNYCAVQQKNSFASSCQEMTHAVSVSYDRGEHMVCPKPRRRLSLLNGVVNEPVRSLRWHMCYQPEPYEPTPPINPNELTFEQAPVASSPPGFSGSPPSRVSNPLTQDTRFMNTKVSIPASGMSLLSSSSSEKKVGSVGGSFCDKPAVRIVGFDCIATLG